VIARSRTSTGRGAPIERTSYDQWNRHSRDPIPDYNRNGIIDGGDARIAAWRDLHGRR
jgi:hypothetical protein